MRRRIYTRRALSIPLQVAFLGGIGLAGEGLLAEWGGGDTVVIVLLLVVLVGEIGLFVMVTKATQIVLSTHGVEILPRTLGQYFQKRRWLSWSDIVGFEGGAASGADPSLIVAKTTAGDAVPIRRVPLWVFDKSDGGDAPVQRVVQQLEEELRVRA